MEIKKNLTSTPKTKPDESKLGFGKLFTDHMFLMDYSVESGWHDARIVPYAPIALDPAAMVLHYGQSVFEGMKAYRTENDEVLLFRPEKNFERMNVSSDRVCIPQIDEEFALQCLMELIEVDADWIPKAKGTSLYIRPYIFATEAALGVHVSTNYHFVIIMSPVGAYYPEGLNPVKISIEEHYVRAVRGGSGYVKASANYAIALKGQEKAKEIGYSQVLWLDGVERKYIEEVGAMNVFFVIGDKVITPSLEGSILPGITRMSVIELLQSWGLSVEERKISVEELYAASEKGELKEAFGTGTAAVISPIGQFKWSDKIISVNNNEIGQLSQRLYDELTGIQNGRVADKFNWTKRVLPEASNVN